VGDVIAGHAVVITEIPLTFELNDRVMGSPAYYGVENDTLVGEWSIGVVTDGVA
jgi:hypothetical protein